MADLLVHGCGSVYLLRPTSPVGVAWVDQRISPDATWFGGAFVVEHRYIRDIVVALDAEGYVIKEA